MVVTPAGQLLALRASPRAMADVPLGSVPPGLADPERVFTHFLFPLFLALSGLVVPAIAAGYTVVTERERRTIELLLALPVRASDILIAKLLALLIAAVVIVLPLFVADVVALLAMHLVTPAYVVLLLIVLVAALVCSIGLALLLALLAREHRTAQNLNGAFTGPLMIVMLLILTVVPGDGRLLVLAAALLAVGAAAFTIGLRWLTFERYIA